MYDLVLVPLMRFPKQGEIVHDPYMVLHRTPYGGKYHNLSHNLRFRHVPTVPSRNFVLRSALAHLQPGFQHCHIDIPMSTLTTRSPALRVRNIWSTEMEDTKGFQPAP